MFLLGFFYLVSIAAALPVVEEILDTKPENGLKLEDKNYAEKVVISPIPSETELVPVGNPINMEKPEESKKSDDFEEPKDHEDQVKDPKNEDKSEADKKTDELNIPDEDVKKSDPHKIVIIELEVQDLPIITRFKVPQPSLFPDINVPFSLPSIFNPSGYDYISYSHPGNRYSYNPYVGYEESELLYQ